MEPNTEGKLPLGICRQAAMKLDSFATDMREIIEDPDIDEHDRAMFVQMAEYAGVMMANLVNIISRECGEEEFFGEQPDMDEIDPYPGTEPSEEDIMNAEL